MPITRSLSLSNREGAESGKIKWPPVSPDICYSTPGRVCLPGDGAIKTAGSVGICIYKGPDPIRHSVRRERSPVLQIGRVLNDVAAVALSDEAHAGGVVDGVEGVQPQRRIQQQCCGGANGGVGKIARHNFVVALVKVLKICDRQTRVCRS